jgi:hypothetical protein
VVELIDAADGQQAGHEGSSLVRLIEFHSKIILSGEYTFLSFEPMFDG